MEENIARLNAIIGIYAIPILLGLLALLIGGINYIVSKIKNKGNKRSK